MSSNLPDWREVAKQSVENTKRMIAAFKESERQAREFAADVLVERMGYEDAVIAAPHLFGWTQSQGGKNSGHGRAAYNEARVLAIIDKLDPKPLPRNLVKALTDNGIGRNPATAALKRLAKAGKLADEYNAHFS